MKVRMEHLVGVVPTYCLLDSTATNWRNITIKKATFHLPIPLPSIMQLTQHKISAFANLVCEAGFGLLAFYEFKMPPRQTVPSVNAEQERSARDVC